VISHSGYLYSGNAEVVRNIISGIIHKSPDAYEIKQIGLVNVSAVTKVPWEVIPTRTVINNGLIAIDNKDLYGELTIPEVVDSWNPDIIFIHNDPWPATKQLSVIPSTIRVIVYLSVDGIPLDSSVSNLHLAARLVTMSVFSKNALLQIPALRGLSIDVISAPADIRRFNPPSEDKKREVRNDTLPEPYRTKQFVIGWIGRNQWRKQMWVNYHAISILKRGDYKTCIKCGALSSLDDAQAYCCKCGSCKMEVGKAIDDILLWIHMPTGKVRGSWDLSKLESFYGLAEGVDVYYTDGCDQHSHIRPEDMPFLYHSWDALLFCSGGEGFGVPALEAMACGLPIIYSNYSSHAEFISKAEAGVCVNGILQPEESSSMMRFISNPHSIAEAILDLRRSHEMRLRLGKNGRSYSESVSVEIISSKWIETFEDCIRK